MFLQSYLTVRPDAVLEKAIAEETADITDKDVPEDFLESMSTDYPASHQKNKVTVVENMDEQLK